MIDADVQVALQTLELEPKTENDWRIVATAAKALADALRQEQARGAIPRVMVGTHVVRLLNSTSAPAEVTTQLLRVLGNSLVDQDQANRRIYLENGTVAAIARILSNSKEAQQVKAGVGAALNLSMDYLEAYSVYVESGLYAALLALLWPGTLVGIVQDNETSQSIVSWVMHIVEEILTTSAFVLSACKACGSEVSVETLLPPSLLRQTIATLCSLILASVATDAPSAVDSLATSAELLEALTLDEDAAPGTFLTKDAQPMKMLEDLCSFVEHATPPETWHKTDATSFHNSRAAVCKVITAAAADHAVAAAVFQDGRGKFLPTLLGWITCFDNADMLEDGQIDLFITASISLANLARKDEYSIRLFREPGLITSVARVLRDRTDSSRDRQKGKPGENTRILHGLLGLLKHLAIPPANKSGLGQAGIISPSLAMLRSNFDVISAIQHNAVGLLKHLAVGTPSNALRISSASALDMILALVERTDDVRLKCEATRILVNTTQTLWSPSSDSSREEAARNAAKDRLASSKALIKALSELIKTSDKYVILTNEGIVALVLLATTPASAALILMELVDERVVMAASATSGALPALNGTNYEPSPVRTDPMPFSATASQQRGPNGNAPARSSSTSSSLSKATSTAAVLAARISDRSLPKEVRTNACKLLEIVSLGTRTSPELATLASICSASLQAARDPTEVKGLRDGAELAWNSLCNP